MKSLYLLVMILTFTYNHSKSYCQNSNIKKNEVTLIQSKENFFVFFQDFCKNEQFQLQRIKFPLQEINLSEDLNDQTDSYIKKEDWEYREIKKFTNNSFEYYFDSFSDKVIKETNEKIYSILGIENGININYYFKSIDGKWYLVKIENLTT